MKERNFKGVWIPKEIWESDELTLREKVFLVEIDSLDGDDGCYASNDHFAKFFGLSKNRCSEVINSLNHKGYITIRYLYKDKTKQIEKRIIKIVKTKYFGIRKTDRGIRKTDRGIRKTEGGYSEKCEDNNTLINNTINNTINNNTCDDIYKKVFDYLEEKNIRLNGKDRSDVLEDLKVYDFDTFKESIDKTISNDAFSYGYVRKILQSIKAKKEKKSVKDNKMKKVWEEFLKDE